MCTYEGWVVVRKLTSEELWVDVVCSGFVKSQIPLRNIQLANQLASWSATCQRAASELDSVMGFGISRHALSCSLAVSQQLASRSQTSCEPICDQVRAISTCRDSSNLSATGRKPGRELVADLLATCSRAARWIGQIPLRCPARQQLASMSQTSSGTRSRLVRQLDSVMEFGLTRVQLVVFHRAPGCITSR